MPKFSIITPVYNGQGYIGRAIESAMKQTYTDWEMIIVDNGSTDDTVSHIKKYLTLDLRVRLIQCKENSGSPARPRNIGLRDAHGEFIAFLDADDAFLPDKLCDVALFFDTHKDVELVCHGEEHIENGRVLRRDYYGPYTTYRDLLLQGNSLSTSAVVIKRSCIHQIGDFSEVTHVRGFEDYEYWLRAAKVCKIKYLRKILGIYTVNYNTETSKISENCKNAIDFLETHYAQWNNKSLIIKLMFRRRKTMLLTLIARQCMRTGDFERTLLLARQGITLYPFSFKQWPFLMLAFSNKVTGYPKRF